MTYYCSTCFSTRWKADKSEFDFTVGDESFKYRFANRINRNYTLYIDRHPARATTLFRKLARLARQTARENPTLKSFLRGAAHHLEAALSHTRGLVRGNAVRAICRKAIRVHAEVLFFSSTPRALREAPNDAAISQASLSDLARHFSGIPRVSERIRTARIQGAPETWGSRLRCTQHR